MSGKPQNSASERAQLAICELAEKSLLHASLLLFGSRARGDARRHSDFDLAVFPREGFSEEELLKFSDALSRSPDIIYEIDLVDMRTASDGLRKRVEAEGQVWKN